ncbi:MAG: hypothetical protein ACTSYM_02620 [Candidatus Baldrarchaeia archaeon]
MGERAMLEKANFTLLINTGHCISDPQYLGGIKHGDKSRSIIIGDLNKKNRCIEVMG